MAELSKEAKTYISQMLDDIMFARRGEELLRGVDAKEIDKFIQDESVRLMEQYGKMGKFQFMLHSLMLGAELEKKTRELFKGKENAPLD